MNEQDKLNKICFWLINCCRETNAETTKITQEKVTYLGKSIGDWEIVIKKKK